jgi:hypothetical protein
MVCHVFIFSAIRNSAIAIQSEHFFKVYEATNSETYYHTTFSTSLLGQRQNKFLACSLEV